MSKLFFQRMLLMIGVVGLAVVLVDLGISIAATFPGTTPARVDHVTAGPYHLAVSLYTNPANAGYALAFAVAPTQAVDGSLTYQTSSLPGQGVDATPIRATFHADPNVRDGIQGAAEITVKGPWTLQVTVNGSAGQGVANIPITATALPPIPVWLGWTIGFVPFYVLCVFFAMQLSRDKKTKQTGTEYTPVSEVFSSVKE
ncbi:MAG: hypothetical protein ACJ8DI_22010 [Ktedonobacteraceae bacterium]